MIARSTVVLVVLAVLAAVGAIALERARPSARLAAAASGRPLFGSAGVEGAPTGMPRAIVVTPAQGAPRRYERDDELGWTQTAPFAHPMLAYSMESLVKAATGLRVLGEMSPDEIDLAALGLAPPHAVVELAWDDGAPVRLSLGRRGLAGRAFLRMGDDPAILVAEPALHERVLEMDERSWRDRRLFLEADADATEIEIRAGADPVVLRREGRAWRLTSPVAARASAPAVDLLLQELGRAQSGGFIVDEPNEAGRFGLEPPSASVTVRGERAALDDEGQVRARPYAETLRIGTRIGAGTADRFGLVEGRPTVVRVPANALRGLFRSAESLVDGTGTGVDPADVKRVRISADGRDFELERDLDEWRAIGADAGAIVVRAVRVEALLRTLSRVQPTEIALADFPRDRAVGFVVLHGFDGRPLDTVRIAEMRDESGARTAWILENGDRVLRFLPGNADLPLAPAELR